MSEKNKTYERVALVGSQSHLIKIMLLDIVPDDMNVKIIEVEKDVMKEVDSVNPDLIVVTDDLGCYWDFYLRLKGIYPQATYLLNSDVEDLFEESAIVDGRVKLDYSVDCSWREFYAGEKKKTEDDLYAFEFYSYKYSRGEDLGLKCRDMQEMSNVLVVLAIAQLLDINLYGAARILRGDKY